MWLDGRSAVELYIDPGEKDENERAFDQLMQSRESIEAAFGGPLDWERLVDRRASRVRYIVEGGLLPEENWPQVQKALVDAMHRLYSALQGHVGRL